MRGTARVAGSFGRRLLAARTIGFALATVLLALGCVGVAAGATPDPSIPSQSFLQWRLQRPDNALTAGELVRWCQAAGSDAAKYCDGYIEGALAFWKRTTACNAAAPADQAFCAGTKASEDRLFDLLRARKDCDSSNALDCMRRFYTEARAALGLCTPDLRRDTNWCAGYNTQAQSELAWLGVFHRAEPAADPRLFGLGDATADTKVALWASKEFHHFVPCVPRDLSPEQGKAVLLRFAADYPEQQRGPHAIELMAKALFYGYCPGPRLGHLRPNREQCLEWNEFDGTFGARNTCDRTVTIRFLLRQQRQAVEQQLAPGKVFSAGMSRQQVDAGAWMFTACGVGEVSSIALVQQNRQRIADSLYSCEPAAGEKTR